MLSKPNEWSKMKTLQIRVNFKAIPTYGEVQLFSNFSPSFWMNQPKLEYIVTSDQDNAQFDF